MRDEHAAHALAGAFRDKVEAAPGRRQQGRHAAREDIAVELPVFGLDRHRGIGIDDEGKVGWRGVADQQGLGHGPDSCCRNGRTIHTGAVWFRALKRHNGLLPTPRP